MTRHHFTAPPPPLLIALLVLLSVVPVGTGALGVVGGLEFGPGTGAVVRYFDSEYRFLNGVWFCSGFVLLWSLRRPVARAACTRTLLGAFVVGGLARLVSALVVGWPSGVFGASLVIELTVIPALLVWHVLRVPSVQPDE